MKILTNYHSQKRSQVCEVLWSLLEAVKKEKTHAAPYWFQQRLRGFSQKTFPEANPRRSSR
jgi:hypothetical protein